MPVTHQLGLERIPQRGGSCWDKDDSGRKEAALSLSNPHPQFLGATVLSSWRVQPRVAGQRPTLVLAATREPDIGFRIAKDERP